MKKYHFLFISFLLPALLQAQWKYPSYEQIQNDITQIGKNKFVTQEAIGKSHGGQPISLLKFQNANKNAPTLLLVAGVDGQHPAGTISALHVAKNLLKLSPDSLSKLLDNKSIWILPLANPDAYVRNASAVLQLTSGNARQIDNDRDGRVDEDPAKDLNGDGVISQMRVKSLAGTYKLHSAFSDYLLAVDPSKGEKGIYELYTESIDADKDGLYGEDGASGVNIDRNFTFDYGIFEPETGEYAASEAETKAILDLLYENPQISTVLHFGLQNNLSIAENFDKGKASERIIKSWSSNDAQVSNYVTSIYNETVKPLGEAPKANAGKGNFSSTAYYHAGRFSFVTPSWWVPSVQDTSKQADLPKKAAPNGKVPDDKFVSWVYKNNIEGAILPWTKVNHPDFPNQEVEVGGVVELYKNNPPVDLLEASSELHSNFVIKLVQSMAALEFSQPKITALGNDIFRVEMRVFNTGGMPTYPEIGDKIRHVSKLKTIIELQKSQQFLSGKRLELYPSLAAGKSQDFSWLIKGKGKVEIVVGCPAAGEKTISVTL
ncbi:M14 family metallopeptidase [Sphingobacterium hungaricum]|uniref:Peptidase M14 n=1 Tax=Sphingobacterium hungaricum TaxID=2082723 RepID=A0A928UW12_9SPHI|nr:M14 family metallopeptidase [Sphingobacterium hungaricum]MBE8713737.1 peptidase M14 [Sphingobacterium hungaricum]